MISLARWYHEVMISCKHGDIHTVCGLRNIPIRYDRFPRCYAPLNDTSKNRRRGNGNTQVYALPRVSIGLLLCSAQVIFLIKTSGARTQTKIPCDELFGGCAYGARCGWGKFYLIIYKKIWYKIVIAFSLVIVLFVFIKIHLLLILPQNINILNILL